MIRWFERHGVGSGRLRHIELAEEDAAISRGDREVPRRAGDGEGARDVAVIREPPDVAAGANPTHLAGTHRRGRYETSDGSYRDGAP